MDGNGKTPRRAIIWSGVMLAAAGALQAGVARAQDEKVGQDLVQYQDMPKDGAQCDQCARWQAPNACTIVSGPIAPKGWCAVFAPQDG